MIQLVTLAVSTPGWYFAFTFSIFSVYFSEMKRIGVWRTDASGRWPFEVYTQQHLDAGSIDYRYSGISSHVLWSAESIAGWRYILPLAIARTYGEQYTRKKALLPAWHPIAMCPKAKHAFFSCRLQGKRYRSLAAYHIGRGTKRPSSSQQTIWIILRMPRIPMQTSS